MAINAEKAFDIDQDGLAIRDEDGNVLFYLAAGLGSPFGFQAPIGTEYMDQSTLFVFRKFGPLVTDWVRIAFNPIKRLNKSFENCFEILFNDELVIYESGSICVNIKEKEEEIFIFYNKIDIELNELLGIKKFTCLGVLNEFG